MVGRIALLHRVGVLEIGDSAVVVAVSAPHREEARRGPVLHRHPEAFGSHLEARVVDGRRELGLEAQHIVGAGAG